MSRPGLLRSLTFPAVLVTATLTGWVVVQLAQAWVDLLRIGLLDAEVLDPEKLADNQDLADNLAQARLVAELLAGTAFILWTWMARTNTEIISAYRHQWSRHWVAIAWFIPIVNFWAPKQIVNDVWRASDPGQLGDEEPRGSLLITLWWTLYLGSTLGELIAAALPERVRLTAYLSLTPVAVAAAALACAIAWRITRLHQAHATRIASALAT